MAVDIEEVKKQLSSMAEEQYQQFSRKLVPGTDNILGVRIPQLRIIAKKLAKEDWQGFMAVADASSHEMLILQGLVLGFAKTDFSTLLPYIDSFIDSITNWAICDTFVGGLKITTKYPQEMRSFVISCLQSTATYRIRFGVVMLLNYYTDNNFLAENLTLLEQITNDDYYVRMAVAWAVSIFFIKQPEQTMPFLQNNHLDKFTHNKTLQKICESRVIDPETKKELKKLKRH